MSEIISNSFLSFAKDIKLQHSIFALPFAVSALLLAKVSMPEASTIALLLVCMVSARSFAMGMNRYLDRRIDTENPRTRNRMIPSGRLSARGALGWSLLWGGLFSTASFFLNAMAGFLSFPLLVILAFYSLTKRFTYLAHLYLGCCLGLAPVAVEIALTGQVSLPVVLLGLGVVFWTGGFDIIYSLQDRRFDAMHGLKSIPVRFGPRRALWLSRVFYSAALLCWSLTGYYAQLGFFFYVGVVAAGGLLFWQHLSLKNLSGEMADQQIIGKAFFDANAFLSLVFLFFLTLNQVLG